jgi:hypothetical protein
MTNTDNTDNSFPYVLLCSTVGTIISLAAVWIAYAPAGLVA